MKHFIWLAVQDRLNTNSLRFKRKITDTVGCLQCDDEEENVLHIFRHCSKARKVWKEVIVHEELEKFERILDNSWMKYNLKGSFKNRLGLEVKWITIFVATVWLLWKSRNAAIFRSAPSNEKQLFFDVKRLSINLQMKVEPNSEFARNQKWNKPLSTWKKLNVDGSVRGNTNNGAIGCVMRDDKGDWVWGYAAPIRHPSINEAGVVSLFFRDRGNREFQKYKWN